ncbi:MAG: RNA polymerase sigma factor FliA [Pseudomonadota bacterium]
MIAYTGIAATATASDDDLVTRHVGLVKRIAHHLAARLPSTVEVDDLMQAGMLGLLEASGNFDPDRGASFETYAGIRIRGAMLDDIRKNDWTPRSVHHNYRRVSEAIREVENAHGRAAEAEEVAEKLGISLGEYHKILADSAGARLFSLDETLDAPGLQRPAPASDSAGPDEELFQTQFRDELIAAIDQLPERERLVLSLYYEQELNMKEIGEVLGISESRVCQIHGQVVIRLRSAADTW